MDYFFIHWSHNVIKEDKAQKKGGMDFRNELTVFDQIPTSIKMGLYKIKQNNTFSVNIFVEIFFLTISFFFACPSMMQK